MKVNKTENRFSTTENRFAQKAGFNIPCCYISLMICIMGLHVVWFIAFIKAKYF